ncbi:MAG: hypothetical protein GY950_06255, partial [bacterium]|nr:hypothetical protein [bacterium]
KIRGYRLELGEIENRLLKHEKIKDAVVVARAEEKSDNGDMHLCAYIVAAPGSGLDEVSSIPELLRKYLSRFLPDYMLPAYFVKLEEIPLTPNGKIDKKVLPAPAAGETGDGYVAPRTHTQRQLAEIWADILRIEKEKIGINANFFEIGGNSLRATKLIARVHQAFDVRIPLARIFQSPTICGTAEEIVKSEKTVFRDLVKLEKKSYYPLSFNQRRLWVLHQVDPTSVAYNLSGQLNFNHAVDETLAVRVLAEMARRHESFRTAFKVVKDEPVQF